MGNNQKWLDDATPSNFRENIMLEKVLPLYHQLRALVSEAFCCGCDRCSLSGASDPHCENWQESDIKQKLDNIGE